MVDDFPSGSNCVLNNTYIPQNHYVRRDTPGRDWAGVYFPKAVHVI
jgi:hypothetical protein